MSGTKLKIIVAGSIASVPFQGGWTWALLQFLLGFKRLGHDVVFIDPVKAEALRPDEQPFRQSINAAYFASVMKEFGLDRSAAMLISKSEQTAGLAYSELMDAAAGADLLINISGTLADDALMSRVARRVYVDLDPGFTQLWSEVQGIDMNFGGHTHFVTIGLGIGQPHCKVPTCGLNWITTPQPIVVDLWPVAGQVQRDALTTVANWRGYGSIEHEGVFYGQKAHSLRQLITLPTMTREKFALALGIHREETKDIAALRENGWTLIEPAEVAATPGDFQRFVQQSKGEFGLAKSGYVAAQCGWISDRSLCYLASGRPVLAQDTGFDRYVPAGRGLLKFSNVEDAVVAIDELNRDYPGHAAAARSIALEYFDSDRVLSRLLAQLM